MNLPLNVCGRLASKGLTAMGDFDDFKEDKLKAAFKNIRTSIPGLPTVP